jgi:hypothetical protein
VEGAVPDGLEARFWALAETQTEEFGFAADCESLMLNFILQGVERLMREGFADNEFKIHEAEVNLSRASELNTANMHAANVFISE